MSVKLGVPSKGRLMEKTFDWFAARGVRLARTGSEREYAGVVDGIDGALEHVFGSGAGWVLLSASVALVLSALGTGKLAGFAAKLVPTKETYASSHEQLLGQVGTALHATDQGFGLAAVRDPGGARLEVRVRTYEDETIARGEPLIVADYDEEAHVFLVTRLPL